MSQRTITTDDMTLRESTDSTHYFVTVSDSAGARTGDKYEIDLSTESHAAFVALLTGKTEEFHKYMRRYVVTDSGPGRRTRGTSPTPRPQSASNENPEETKRARQFVKDGNHGAPVIKTWGRDNGLSEFVKDGPGVLPGALVVAFAKAHGMPDAPADTSPSNSQSEPTETAPAES